MKHSSQRKEADLVCYATKQRKINNSVFVYRLTPVTTNSIIDLRIYPITK
ncbi:TPA: hypothetical protein RJD93_001231 [Legionella pneumophila]|nr:hypothetical protein [Legionella pneumophila]HDV5813994.1 hypothetical protein [Legionella pneumophila]